MSPYSSRPAAGVDRAVTEPVRVAVVPLASDSGVDGAESEPSAGEANESR